MPAYNKDQMGQLMDGEPISWSVRPIFKDPAEVDRVKKIRAEVPGSFPEFLQWLPGKTIRLEDDEFALLQFKKYRGGAFRETEDGPVTVTTPEAIEEMARCGWSWQGVRIDIIPA